MTKLCRDCRWVEPSTDFNNDDNHAWRYAKCRAPSNLLIDRKSVSALPYISPGLQTKPEHRFDYCTTMRAAGWFAARLVGLCGREGRWFEPKEPR